MHTEDRNQKIIIRDDLHPEDGAMLQALYSRSPAGVEHHLKKVEEVGAGKFMSQYYVGYGHASIGDCGVTNIFIENYSMLACKAIQDNPLYSGQEASTRYLDFSTQPSVDPYNTPYTRAILDEWLAIYNSWMPKVIAALKVRYPFSAEGYKSEKAWENAIQVRAFDTMRAYLPVGTTTLFSWTTNLRQARDKLMKLKSHPLAEVRTMAQDLFNKITEKYPNSFSGAEMDEHSERYGARDAYNAHQSVPENYEDYNKLKKRFNLTAAEEAGFAQGVPVIRKHLVDVATLNTLEKDALSTRPRGGVLPKHLAAYGNYNLACAIDFGSYRDIQRHRNGVAPLPLIEPTFGMFYWYTNELSSLLGADYTELEEATKLQFNKIQNLEAAGIAPDPLLTQYLLPMGTTVICSLSYSVPQMVYVGELRSGKTVHPSLRPIAQKMLKVLQQDLPEIALYGDMDADSWTEKRGTQTITEKKAS